jgi:tripartite-type tricarboxylate transporter receptor subunit TctC
MNSISRRTAVLCPALFIAGRAFAQSGESYPAHPIRLVLGTAPGDQQDTNARAISIKLTGILQQPVIIDNKPGGHGAIAALSVKNSEKTGYSIFMSSGGPMAINPSLYRSLAYNPQSDFEPIVLVSKKYLYLLINNDIPARNLKEFVEWAKAHDGQLNYGSGGSGTTQHLAMELLKKATGLNITHVPYRGSPMALQDLMGGRLVCVFDSIGSVLPQVKAGKVRAIAVTSQRRLDISPAIPTFTEMGYRQLEIQTWQGMFAPQGTPPAIIGKLNEAMNQILRMPEFVAALEKVAETPVGGAPAVMKSFLAEEIARWAPVVKESGAQVD